MSTLFDDLVNDVSQTLYGYGLAQPRAAWLTASIDDAETVISVGDASGFSQGVAEVDNEMLFIASVDYGSNVLTVAPDGRGYYATSADVHSSGTRITMAPTWSRARIATAVNETILGTYPTLFGVGSTSFTYNPSITTYQLPAEANRILKVTTDTIGPSKEQMELNRWSFNSVAPVSEFATGNTITLEQAPFPGRTVTVTYERDLSEITFGDFFTDCGLAETAKLAVKYGACSNLVAFMDSARLPVDTAEADEIDASRNGIGTAMRASTQLYQRYQIELEAERRRLRKSTPVPITMRTR